MKLAIALVCGMLAVSVVMAQYPTAEQISVPAGGQLGWDNSAKKWVPMAVSANGAMPFVGTFSASMEHPEAYDVASMYNITLTPGVSRTIPPLTGRKEIGIGINNSAEAWVSFSGPAAIGAGQRFFQSVTATIKDNIPVSVISSTAANLCIVQLR